MLFSASFLLPLLTGIYYHEGVGRMLVVFGLPMSMTLVFGLLLWYIGAEEVESLREREGFAVVSLGWLLVAFFGALPYILSGTLTHFVDAYFESMSGFATCGATVISAPPDPQDYLDVYAHSIFMWRALTQWIGGLGIIVFSVVILARILGGGMHLFKAEVAGHTVTRLRPKLQQTARLLWGIYLLFTLIEIALLKSAGVGLYDAITHSFTTLATGGFGTHKASVAYWNSPWVDAIFCIFILIGSISFVVHWQLLRGRVRSVLRDEELQFFLFLVCGSVLFITLDLYLRHVYTSAASALRYGAFQAITIQGTAGFTTADFGSYASTWPVSSQLLLVLLMLIGGCVGSTAGAIKVSRILIMLKVVKREIQKVIHPRSVIPIRIGNVIVPEEIVHKISVFFFAYIASFFAISLMLTAVGLDIPSAFSAVATTMGGVGPGLGSVAADMCTVPSVGKVILSLAMWLGRLEIFAALIIFAPSTYKS